MCQQGQIAEKQHHRTRRMLILWSLQAPAALADILQDVQLPQDHVLLRPARQLLLHVQEGTSLSTRLQQLAGDARTMPPLLRHRALSALALAVEAERGGLLSEPCQPSTSGRASTSNAGSSAAVPRLCLPEVEQAAWHLTWLAGELGDDAMAAFAGRLGTFVCSIICNIISSLLSSSIAKQRGHDWSSLARATCLCLP